MIYFTSLSANIQMFPQSSCVRNLIPKFLLVLFLGEVFGRYFGLSRVMRGPIDGISGFMRKGRET